MICVSFAGSMKYRTRRNFQFTLRIGSLVVLLSSLFSVVINGFDLRFLPRGLVIGALIGFPAAAYTLFVAEGKGRDLMKWLNFSGSLLVNTTVYLALILFGRGLGMYLSGHSDQLSFFPGLGDPIFRYTLIFAGLVSLIINFILQIGGIIGNRVLLNFVWGLYHSPREEERLFLFADLAQSSAIAEKIGDVKFLKLLDLLFRDMTEPILRARAQIYKYVGDEIILTWKIGEEQRALGFFFQMERVLASRAEFYNQEFGCVPEFRAGMHAGRVATGELGEIKKEIAYMGDALNTTARITELCKVENRSLLVSDTIPKLFAGHAFDFKLLGERELRGKALPCVIYAVEKHSAEDSSA